MDTVLLVNVCDGSDELRKGFLDLIDGELAMSQKVVIKFLA